MDDLSLKNIIEQELGRKEIELPIVDFIANTIGQLLSKDDVDFNKLAKVIEKDPSLTAKVMNLANSAFYAGLVKTKNVDRAIARVGLLAIRSFLMTVSLKDVFKGNVQFQEGFRLNWQHSLGCAICCKHIAEHVRLRSIAEDAYMLGLLHDIGTVSIFNALSKVSKKLEGTIELSDDLVNEVIGTFHAAAGSRILSKLKFEERFCRIVAMHHKPEKYPDKDDQLFNILFISNSLVKKLGVAFEPDPDISIMELEASKKLGLEAMFVEMLEADLKAAIVNMENLL
jgi:HD-like signal output (HDOD) protein